MFVGAMPKMLITDVEEDHMVVRFLLSACAAAGLLTAMSAAALADGDAAAGKKVFNKCKICHSLEAGENKIGPSLAGIIDRPAGTIEGFKYSEAMAGSGKTWDAATLDQYLADPKGFIPGNKMAFAGLNKEADRAIGIAYVQSGGE
jgi:cytochrome c